MVLKAQGRYNQLLEERSNLTLEFPNGEIRRVPFFENPDINESKKANYIKYSPLGRSSPLYSYFNSDSRAFEISFNFSLDHIYDTFSRTLTNLTFPLDTVDLTKLTRDSFLERGAKNLSFGVEVKGNGARIHDQEYLSLFPLEAKAINSDVRKGKAKVIDFILYWINLIRATTLNNSKDPSQGPPIVRLTHGIMYKDIPCICVNYKISSEEAANYDRNTLLPRLITISMSLLEIRHGDFTRYEAAKAIKRDNVVGWEAIIDRSGSKTTDPLPIRRNF
jgi:hypothetical protein